MYTSQRERHQTISICFIASDSRLTKSMKIKTSTVTDKLRGKNTVDKLEMLTKAWYCFCCCFCCCFYFVNFFFLDSGFKKNRSFCLCANGDDIWPNVGCPLNPPWWAQLNQFGTITKGICNSLKTAKYFTLPLVLQKFSSYSRCENLKNI